MDTFSITKQGVVLAGHRPRPAARLEAARHLVDRHAWGKARADEATEDATVARAWWAATLLDDRQRAGSFVGEGHSDGVAVTVVNIANAP